MTHDEWVFVIIANVIALLWWAESAWFKRYREGP